MEIVFLWWCGRYGRYREGGINGAPDYMLQYCNGGGGGGFLGQGIIGVYGTVAGGGGVTYGTVAHNEGLDWGASLFPDNFP